MGSAVAAIDAPNEFRRFFRFSQLAFGNIGTTEHANEVWNTLLQELKDLGIPADAHSRIKTMGPNQVLSGKAFAKGLPDSVVGMAGGSANTRAIKEAVKAARAAKEGLSGEALVQQWKEFLSANANDPVFSDENGKRIFAELKAVDPKLVAKYGPSRTVSALSVRGDDPMIVRMFNKTFKRPGLPKIPQGIQDTLKSLNEGKLPKVGIKAGIEFSEAGVKGMGIGRKVLGLAGRSKMGMAIPAIAAGFEINRAAGILGRKGRAKKMALQGFSEMGPSSSVDYLRNRVQQQESVARRSVTMQKFEPELFQDVIRVLSDVGEGPGSLTSSERRIGSSEEVGQGPRGRSKEDVKFLLDQLFNQMGG
jgi:hypothetical protein